MHKRILVTGAAGFIGANFCHYWSAKYPQSTLVAFDALTYAGDIRNLDNLKDKESFVFRQGNICDEALVEDIMREYSIDTVVHFAAESHVDRSIVSPDAFINTNIIGTYTLLKVAKKLWLDAEDPLPNHRFHHVSTDEVYGTLAANDAAFTEATQYAPNSPYSASKAASDHLVRSYCHTYNLQVTTSNCSNNYGPFHFPEKLIPLVITNILKNKLLPVYGDGKQIRDWLYVEDHCRGIDLVLEKGQTGETYNIGGNNEWTNIEIVELICELTNKRFATDASLRKRYPEAVSAINSKSADLVRFVDDRPGHDRRYAVDATKALKELGYIPQESFATGIEKTISWYLKNPDWWEAHI